MHWFNTNVLYHTAIAPSVGFACGGNSPLVLKNLCLISRLFLFAVRSTRRVWGVGCWVLGVGDTALNGAGDDAGCWAYLFSCTPPHPTPRPNGARSSAPPHQLRSLFLLKH
ncbi:MAG: hypothetical protein V7L05_22205 [Nostoc sp.]